MALVMPLSTGNFFEHFHVGRVFDHPISRTITNGDCSLYIALTGSRRVLHCCEPFAQSLGYPTPPVEDFLAFHIAFGKTVSDISLNAVANLGYADVRFLAPVYCGDTLSTSSTVIGVKENSNGKNGIVYVHSIVKNQKSQQVMEWKRWVMVHKRDNHYPAPPTEIPRMNPVVETEHLFFPDFVHLDQFDTKETGGKKFWGDYQVGERINHVAGMTVDESDHALATKLYQNNAHLHFDALLMKESSHGRRLIYGGHIISICHALAYDGLENMMTVLAINAGVHCNPSYAGDTFYTWTEVLDKIALPNRSDCGVLRLRRIGIKNLRPDEFSQLITPFVLKEGRNIYHENVVLDLDYFILLPRK